MAKANFVFTKKNNKNDDPDAMVTNQNAHNYKGFFYGDNTEQIYYQGGAHFEYNDLCTRLNNILQIQNAKEKEFIQKTKEIAFSSSNNHQPKQTNLSRNKQIIAGSNTLKSVHSTKTNFIGKSTLLNNPYLSKIINGADTIFNQGLNNHKSDNYLVKQVENYSKLEELKKNIDEMNIVKSSINLKSSNDNLELKKSLFGNKIINSGFNCFLVKSDVKFNSKYYFNKN